MQPVNCTRWAIVDPDGIVLDLFFSEAAAKKYPFRSPHRIVCVEIREVAPDGRCETDAVAGA